jgi:hypothetical protein
VGLVFLRTLVLFKYRLLLLQLLQQLQAPTSICSGSSSTLTAVWSNYLYLECQETITGASISVITNYDNYLHGNRNYWFRMYRQQELVNLMVVRPTPTITAVSNPTSIMFWKLSYINSRWRINLYVESRCGNRRNNCRFSNSNNNLYSYRHKFSRMYKYKNSYSNSYKLKSNSFCKSNRYL